MLTGRFAPSPTGPLHMGSLITALASFLDIKTRGGEWYVRIDNIDPPRESLNAVSRIVASLKAHGLFGDREVDFQSRHEARYEAALEQLRPHLFYCTCSRRKLAGHTVYPGTCRGNDTPIANAAIRVHTAPTTIKLKDGIVGERHFNLSDDFGDFIVKRRDGLWAYNFATALDDGSDTTHVLRGQDLLDVTPQQIYLMQLLSLPVPRYAHLPVLRFPSGIKLSKQTQAPSLNNGFAADNLRKALHYLGFRPPEQTTWAPSHWLAWAMERWNITRLPHELASFQAT